jgi:hypothetical protein
MLDGAELDLTVTAGACWLEKIGAILVCNPKNSVAESIKAKFAPFAPTVVMVASNAKTIAKMAKPLTREKRKDFWLRNI